MKSPVILRIFKNGQLVEVKQFDQQQIIVGNEADVQVDLKDEAVSTIHCLIELRDSGYYVCDLGSQTGTFKNGKQILDEPVSSGDTVVIGPFSLQFFIGVPKPKAPPVMTVAPPAVPVSPTQPVSASPTEPPPAPSVSGPKAPPPAPPAQNLKPSSQATVADGGGLNVISETKLPPKLPESKPKKVSISKSQSAHDGTFAPASEIEDLKTYLQPTRGNSLEVLVAWNERILDTYHFSPSKNVIKAGSRGKADVFTPDVFLSGVAPLVSMNQGQAQVFSPSGVDVETVTQSQRFSLDDLIRIGKATKSAQGHSIKLEQGDIVCLSFAGGSWQIFIRFVPATPKPAVASLLDFSSSELTGMVAAIVLVSLFALYMSVYTPTPVEEEKPEDPARLATFVYNKPTETPPPEKIKPTPTPEPQQVKATPTPPPKKVKVTDKEQPQKKIGKAESTAAASEKPATRAAEVRPNPSKLNRPKKFTSTNSGGAVKIGNTASANANSPNDVTKTGLLSAFGSGGNRSKLDQAYTGSGELLGLADKATGTSGQNESRPGDDIGSKIKDTGAGGKGTATQGIAGVGTKGKSSGQYAYGGVGVGGKGNVAIEAGGADAEFVGTIDKEAVRRVIRSIISQIKSCYERQLRSDTSLEGKIVIQFEIEEQGRVRVASTKSTSMNNSAVESCVASRIKEQRFPEPPPGTVAVVDFPFVFGAQK